jgi:hypothetical protein
VRIRLSRFAALALAIGLVVPLFAQPGRGMRGPRYDAAFLAGQKSVQEEIKMTEDQIAKVKKTSEELREKYADDLKSAGKDFEKRAEIQQKISAATGKAVGEILKPEQMKRIKQIEVQLGGLGALVTEDVSKALKLSEKQVSDAKGALDDVRKDSAEIFKDAGFKDKEKAAEAREKVSKLNKEATAKFISSLSADQKKAYKDLIGDEFKGKIEFTFGGGRPGKDKKDKEEE